MKFCKAPDKQGNQQQNNHSCVDNIYKQITALLNEVQTKFCF